MKERMKITGKFVAVLRDRDGKVKQRITTRNAFTDDGYDLLCALLGSGAEDFLSHLAIGWGTGADTPFSADQVDLQGEYAERKAAVFAHAGGTKVLTLSATWGIAEPIDDTVNIEEYGVFNALAGPTMLSRAVRSPALSKLTTDELDLTWTLTLSQP